MREKLRKYAELLVRAGGNVQVGQPVVIGSDLANVEFARMVQDCAYDAGACEVLIDWYDEASVRTRYLRAADEIFDDFPQWRVDRFEHYDGRGVVYLHIISDDPDLLVGVDTDRLQRSAKVKNQKLKAHYRRTMSNELRWSMVALPSPKWAAKVFPGLDQVAAVDKLWGALLKGSRADGADPIADWDAHRKTFEARLKLLNERQFGALHFSNSLGTDITIGLPKDHVWGGGGDVGKDGVPFFPNIPTEEIFTAPHRLNVNGKVVASMPLVYHGNLIEDFCISFKDGRVVDYEAKANQELLKTIIEMDEGSHYLGEVALVANSSPISQMGILFYETLFDENASSHLALGKAYPDCIKNGSKLTEDQLLKAGINDSLTHIDFMFGTADMTVTAADSTAIMRDGEFVI